MSADFVHLHVHSSPVTATGGKGLLRISRGDVLDAKADGLLLAIDGTAPGMEGNVARAFARKWPEAWEWVESEISYPVPLGEVISVNADGQCPFRYVQVASTLHHQDVMLEAAKKSVVRTAFENAILQCAGLRVRSMATTVMAGGWRLPVLSAFAAMMEGYESATRQGYELAIEVRILDQGTYQAVESLRRGIGF